MTEWSVAWTPGPLIVSWQFLDLFSSPLFWTNLTGDNDPPHTEVFTTAFFNHCHYLLKNKHKYTEILLQDSKKHKNTGAESLKTRCFVSIRLGVLKAYFVLIVIAFEVDMKSIRSITVFTAVTADEQTHTYSLKLMRFINARFKHIHTRPVE